MLKCNYFKKGVTGEVSMLNFEQEVELGKRLDIWSVGSEKLQVVDLNPEGISAALIYEPTPINGKGGKRIIVGNDWKVLFISSAFSLTQVIHNIKYNSLWEQAVDIKITLK